MKYAYNEGCKLQCSGFSDRSTSFNQKACEHTYKARRAAAYGNDSHVFFSSFVDGFLPSPFPSFWQRDSQVVRPSTTSSSRFRKLPSERARGPLNRARGRTRNGRKETGLVSNASPRADGAIDRSCTPIPITASSWPVSGGAGHFCNLFYFRY